MSYCPNCKFEYPRQMTSCPDCGGGLVAKLSGSFSPAMSPDDSWVLIGGVSTKAKAKVARGSLNSNNIPSVFLSSGLDAEVQLTFADIDMALSDKKADLILVPKEFGDQAKLILEAVLGEELIQPVVDNPLI